MAAVKTGTVRRNLTLRRDFDRSLSEMAKRHGTSTADLIKSLLKVGLAFWEALHTPGTEVLIRDANGERTIRVVL